MLWFCRFFFFFFCRLLCCFSRVYVPFRGVWRGPPVSFKHSSCVSVSGGGSEFFLSVTLTGFFFSSFVLDSSWCCVCLSSHAALSMFLSLPVFFLSLSFSFFFFSPCFSRRCVCFFHHIRVSCVYGCSTFWSLCLVPLLLPFFLSFFFLSFSFTISFFVGVRRRFWRGCLRLFFRGLFFARN